MVVMETTRFRSYAPDQLLLLPPDLREWLPEGHLARISHHGFRRGSLRVQDPAREAHCHG
jgi:hypothetical protein